MLTIRFWNPGSPNEDEVTYVADWIQFDGDCLELGSFITDETEIIAHYGTSNTSDPQKKLFFDIKNSNLKWAENFTVLVG